MSAHGTVIIGAGQAGYQVAAQLRQKGYADPVILIGDEAHIPYQQPPLSKAYLKGELDGDRLPFRPADFYENKDIDLRLSEAVTAIDTSAKTVQTAKGSLSYDKLVIATGGTPDGSSGCGARSVAPSGYMSKKRRGEYHGMCGR